MPGRVVVHWAVLGGEEPLRAAAAAALGRAPDGVRVARCCRRCGSPAHGPPRVAGAPRLQVSVSHAGGWVAVALALDSPLGVDAEDVAGPGARVGPAGVLRVAAAPGEHGWAAGPDDDGTGALVRALTLWTRKEAVLKATGGAGVVRPRAFRVSAPGAPPRLVSWPGDPTLPRRLRLRALSAPPGHVASLAVAGPVGDVVQVLPGGAADERAGPQTDGLGPGREQHA
ncbi:4'-phosphopantetheinyl transferase family protein [Geodermatophilus sp. SYSU D00758]